MVSKRLQRGDDGEVDHGDQQDDDGEMPTRGERWFPLQYSLVVICTTSVFLSNS